MKKIITVLFVFTFVVNYAQKNIKINEENNLKESKITSVSYSVNNPDELKTIDWKKIKDVFRTNKDGQEIKLSFELDLKKSKNKFKTSYTVSGQTKNIDSLIIKAQKGIKGIIKLSYKYQN